MTNIQNKSANMTVRKPNKEKIQEPELEKRRAFMVVRADANARYFGERKHPLGWKIFMEMWVFPVRFGVSQSSTRILASLCCDTFNNFSMLGRERIFVFFIFGRAFA